LIGRAKAIRFTTLHVSNEAEKSHYRISINVTMAVENRNSRIKEAA